jgi:hypothetical protein
MPMARVTGSGSRNSGSENLNPHGVVNHQLNSGECEPRFVRHELNKPADVK